MKKIILLLIFILVSFASVLTLVLIPSVSAICCQNIGSKEGGCYPDRPICCEETDKNVGYIGCKAVLDASKPTEFTYYCPGKPLGSCLQCSSNCKPDGTGCDWVEVDKCSGLSCVIEYLPETKIPSIVSSCTNKCMEGEVEDLNGNCIKIEDAKKKNIEVSDCTNNMCPSNKYCCGTKGQRQEGEGSICSGDNDKDDICNYYDNCDETPNSETLGTCLPLTIKQTCTKAIPCPQGGHCSNSQNEDSDKDKIGNACDIEERCESAYSDRQCCDLLGAKSAKDATFYGYQEDCPQNLGGVGCWSKCAIIDEATGKEITFDISPCIDSQRTVTKLQDGKPIGTPTKEPCSGIPLIPFFTSFNLIFTFLILFLYYFREK